MSKIISTVFEVTEEEAATFCGNCDKLGNNNVCKGIAISVEDQARYVERGFCGWAIVGGVRGRMTPNGFEPWGQ